MASAPMLSGTMVYTVPMNSNVTDVLANNAPKGLTTSEGYIQPAS